MKAFRAPRKSLGDLDAAAATLTLAGLPLARLPRTLYTFGMLAGALALGP